MAHWNPIELRMIPDVDEPFWKDYLSWGIDLAQFPDLQPRSSGTHRWYYWENGYGASVTNADTPGWTFIWELCPMQACLTDDEPDWTLITEEIERYDTDAEVQQALLGIAQRLPTILSKYTQLSHEQATAYPTPGSVCSHSRKIK